MDEAHEEQRNYQHSNYAGFVRTAVIRKIWSKILGKSKWGAVGGGGGELDQSFKDMIQET